ncbi:N-hydroxyarylamine O-acetyltransferase [Chryseobacterium lactis]|uniref:Arylamine N-acetyltransferase n=1 Tax=Chryseobacterium lactis TaxID=1241981 RepID=A0A3G6RHV9_CHRLC|nr:arylamine N-acetyltransferase [Chryseobacterium lactis]AZA83070.1 arylamine N-acetyltransferase [Chryseobacterium lactis]AZB03453.1 arylamine N-acetyltransferase [Chryseobacterium lactis]PNW12043.1 N-hydroxyarylamine O-acetyltransferase [Chryseobacterium lactis]
MNQSKLEKYLERIHYSGETRVDMGTLKKIHQLHPQYIPFENIDPYTGIVPSLNSDDLFQKLVMESRGGYCYEQNLLLSEVLKYIGFKVELQLGRVVWKREVESIAARTHLLLIVEMDEQKYLVDCGFGTATLTTPLLLNEEGPQQTPNGLFMISRIGNTNALWTWKEKWLPIYRFALEHVDPVDVEIANWYLSTHPESNFKKNLILSKVDEKARYTFSNHLLNIRWGAGEKESIPIENNEQLFQMLKDTFGLKENAVELLKQKIEKQ